jgi:hypothetical protein
LLPLSIHPRQVDRTLALDIPNHLRHRVLRRNRDSSGAPPRCDSPSAQPTCGTPPPRCCLNCSYSVRLRHLGMNTTWYLHSHLVWLRLSYSSIVDLPFLCFGGSRPGVSAMDFLRCQTLTATPAEPGGLPW